jgi:hypothetical protein
MLQAGESGSVILAFRRDRQSSGALRGGELLLMSIGDAPRCAGGVDRAT